jgi:hypothetical protein
MNPDTRIPGYRQLRGYFYPDSYLDKAGYQTRIPRRDDEKGEGNP